MFIINDEFICHLALFIETTSCSAHSLLVSCFNLSAIKNCSFNLSDTAAPKLKSTESSKVNKVNYPIIHLFCSYSCNVSVVTAMTEMHTVMKACYQTTNE